MRHLTGVFTRAGEAGKFTRTFGVDFAAGQFLDGLCLHVEQVSGNVSLNSCRFNLPMRHAVYASPMYPGGQRHMAR